MVRCGDCEAAGLVEPCFCPCCGRPLPAAHAAQPHTSEHAAMAPGHRCASCGAPAPPSRELCDRCADAFERVLRAQPTGAVPTPLPPEEAVPAAVAVCCPAPADVSARTDALPSIAEPLPAGPVPEEDAETANAALAPEDDLGATPETELAVPAEPAAVVAALAADAPDAAIEIAPAAQEDAPAPAPPAWWEVPEAAPQAPTTGTARPRSADRPGTGMAIRIAKPKAARVAPPVKRRRRVTAGRLVAAAVAAAALCLAVMIRFPDAFDLAWRVPEAFGHPPAASTPDPPAERRQALPEPVQPPSTVPVPERPRVEPAGAASGEQPTAVAESRPQ